MSPRDIQSQQLTRVSDRIADAILAFASKQTSTFRADDLRAFVTTTVGTVAPGSADRVLRDLRQRGQIDYRVVNRRASLYELVQTSLSP